MRPWQSSLAKAILMLGLSAPVLMWMRSYWRADRWSSVNSAQQAWTIASYQGSLHLIRSDTPMPIQKIDWTTGQDVEMKTAPQQGVGSQPVPANADWSNFYPAGQIDWRLPGIHRISRVTLVQRQSSIRWAPSSISPFVRGPATTQETVAFTGGPVAVTRILPLPEPQFLPWLFNAPFDAISIAWLWLSIPAIFAAVLALRNFANRVYRKKHNFCVACGYDLRASTDRCPECGTPFVA